MPQNIEEVINKNKYVFRNSGFVCSFIIQILILIATFCSPELTDNQAKVFDTGLTSCYIYQLCYLTNNAADFAVKLINIKKGA